MHVQDLLLLNLTEWERREAGGALSIHPKEEFSSQISYFQDGKLSSTENKAFIFQIDGKIFGLNAIQLVGKAVKLFFE